MPKTDVAYGATKAFAKHFPNELAAQNEKFNRPSWQTRINETEVHTVETRTEQRRDIWLMALGALFFAGVAYLAVRGVQWHLIMEE